MTAYGNVLDALRSAGLRTSESASGARSQCPGHQSRGLTLAIRPAQRDAGPVLVHCHAGCGAADVLAEVGLTLADLYDDNGSRDLPTRVGRYGSTHTRPKPTPWDLLGDMEHFTARCLQQQQIDGVPLEPIAELDRAWAAHCAETAPRAAVTPPMVFDDPGRQASFAEWVAERLEADPTLAPPEGRVVLRGSNGRNRVFDPGDPGYATAARLAAEVES